MKRKLLALLVMTLLLVTLATPAFADVIWEPNNAFHKTHSHQCTYHNRAYLVNGKEGYVTVLNAPDGVGQITNVANGTRFFAEYIWTDKDGTQWAIGYPAGDHNSEGWVCMSDLVLIYDYICFEEDYGDEFEKYNGADLNLVTACAYSYPGGVFRYVLEGSEQYPIDGFSYLYTDKDGLRWAYVSYYCGCKNLWVCLDDPANEKLGTDNYLPASYVREEAYLPNDPNGEPDDDPSPLPEDSTVDVLYPPADEIPPTMPLWLIPAVLIVVVAVVTAILLRRRRKKAA